MAGLAHRPRNSRFDPRPCARGDCLGQSLTKAWKGFDPRPCARGDEAADIVMLLQVVSIHAPARGATAPPAGSQPHLTCFDPRPCARGDRPYHTRLFYNDKRTIARELKAHSAKKHVARDITARRTQPQEQVSTSANPTVAACPLLVRAGHRGLKYQRPFQIKNRLRTHMLHRQPARLAQAIEPQTIARQVHLAHQPGA